MPEQAAAAAVAGGGAGALNRSLTLLIHGQSKAGKSSMSATAPYPRLMLDVEGGAKFLPIVTKVWNPVTEEPPALDGTWDTAVVVVRQYDDALRAYQWLQSGKHPFASVIVDSISELQAKALESIAGRNQVQMQDWGSLLRHINGFMRDLRDLTMHPTNPLQAVVLTAMARKVDDLWRPYLQGQAATTAPYLFDVVGYLEVVETPNPDPTKGPIRHRQMLVTPNSHAVAGERVGGKLGDAVPQHELSIEHMISKIYGAGAGAGASA